MSKIDCFDRGRELYLDGRYDEAVECFFKGVVEKRSNVCRGWLGYCYELGLGVKKELVLAKDLYEMCRRDLRYSDTKFALWLDENLVRLKDVGECKSVTKKVEGIGNVKVVKNRNLDKFSFRYNNDEVVVMVRENYHTFVDGFYYAEKYLPDMNKEWTCDGENRFYDGYTIDTDYFRLEIRRGDGDGYKSCMRGRELCVWFPREACLQYLYVQERIFGKVKKLLWKRAQEVIPMVLERVAKRIGVEYGRCEVVKSLRSCSAFNYALNNDITFSGACIQLPEKSLEALCVHELTHNFVLEHGREFDNKMIELGGIEMYNIYKNLWKEGRWRYLLY